MRHLCFTFLFLFSLACFSQDTINITLHPSDTLNPIASDFAGLSFEKNCLNRGYFGPSRDTLIRLFKTCRIKSLRIGGNSVDKDTLSMDTTDSTHFKRADLDSLFLFAKSAGCRIFIGLNFGGDYNPSLADTEASYVIQKYDSVLFGFEVGNEPDLYDSSYRKPKYTVTDYENQYKNYYDTIKRHNPEAVFTGPACASHHYDWTEPFRRDMDTKISMLTQHYYGGVKGAATVPVQIDSLMSKYRLRTVSYEVTELVKCADHIPFRMSECNSLDNGGQKGVSDAFASALWSLGYMYQLACESCAGVNFHGGLDGAYTVFSRNKKDNIYSARPIAYGILAFQIGSKGRFISSKVIKKDSINLENYSVIDSIKSIYTTIINKETDTSKYAVINLDAGDTHYRSAEYVRLSSDSLGDTTTVTLGGQVVNSSGIIGPYTWVPATVTLHTTQIRVRGGSAVVIRFHSKIGNSINDNSKKNKHFLNLYPNPASEKVTIITDMSEHAVISVYNLQGQILLQQQVQQGETDIDISELAKGVYIVRLTGNAGVEVGRIIKE